MKKGISKEEADMLEDSAEEETPVCKKKPIAKGLQSAELKTKFVKAKKDENPSVPPSKKPETKKETAPVTPKKATATLPSKPAVAPRVAAPPVKQQANVEPDSLSDSSPESEIEAPLPAKIAPKPVAKPVAKPAAKPVAVAQHRRPSEESHSIEQNTQSAKRPKTVSAAPVMPAKPASQPWKSQPVAVKAAPAVVSKAPVKAPVPPPTIKAAASLKEKRVIETESEPEEEQEEEQEEEEEREEEEEQEEEEEEQEQEEEEEQEDQEEEEEEEEPAPAPPVRSVPAAKSPASNAGKSSGAQNTPQKPQSKEGAFEVHVGNISFECSQDDLTRHFNKCADFAGVKMISGPDGQFRGRAFVKFASERGQSAALELNSSSLKGRKIFVELPRPQGERSSGPLRNNFGSNPGTEGPSVIVRNLPFQMDETALQRAFEGCGGIVSARIIRNEDGSNRGFGFIDFKDVEAARRAVKKNGDKFGGREINVQFQIPRGERQAQGDRPARGGFSGGRGGFSGGRDAAAGSAARQKKGFIEDSQMEVVEFD